MRKPRSRPPANDMRPTRRSLVDLTAAASRAVDDGMLVMPVFPVAAATADAPRQEEAPNRLAPTAEPKQALEFPVREPANRPSRRAAASPDTGSTAEMLVDIVKDHQARALEDIRLGLSAALDCAKDLAKTPVPADRDPPDGGARAEDNKAGDNLRAAAGAAAEYRAETFEIAKAHAATTLDYARELTEARTAAEFVELSSALARKQCELMLKQASVLQSFARKVAKPGDREDG